MNGNQCKVPTSHKNMTVCVCWQLYYLIHLALLQLFTFKTHSIQCRYKISLCLLYVFLWNCHFSALILCGLYMIFSLLSWSLPSSVCQIFPLWNVGFIAAWCLQQLASFLFFHPASLLLNTPNTRHCGGKVASWKLVFIPLQLKYMIVSANHTVRSAALCSSYSRHI